MVFKMSAFGIEVGRAWSLSNSASYPSSGMCFADIASTAKIKLKQGLIKDKYKINRYSVSVGNV